MNSLMRQYFFIRNCPIFIFIKYFKKRLFIKIQLNFYVKYFLFIIKMIML